MTDNEKKEINFRKVFGIGFPERPVRSCEWDELHETRGTIKRAMKKALDKCEKEERDLNASEAEAFEMCETCLDTIDREMQERTSAGNKGPRPVRLGGNGKTRNAARTGGELRSGEVGLRFEQMYGDGDGLGGYESREHFYSCVLNNTMPEQRTMVEGVATQGGFTVPTEVTREIYNSAMETSVCLPYVRQFRMGSSTLQIPCWDSENRSEGGIGAFEGDWLAEEGTATPKTPKLRLVQLTAKKLAVFVNISRECISDSLTLGQQLGPAMVRNLAYSLDAAILGSSGTGVGRPLSVLNSPSKVQVNRAAANAIAWADVVSMFTRMYPGFIGNARWYVSPSAMQQLITMVDAGNNSVWIAGNSAPAAPATLLGRPVHVSEKCAALGTEGDIIFADMSQYAFGLREDFILERTNAAYWTQDLVSLRALCRCDGHSLLDTVITPASGSTLSWAVTLV